MSIREIDGQEYIKEIMDKTVPIMPDPTLLLDADDYNGMVGKRLIEGDYIFFYTLFASREMIDIVKKISHQYKLPVVISNISNQYEIFNNFIKIKDAGPQDFLSLVRHAKLNIVSSFHGTVFSIIFRKPFFSINGLFDNRISTLLESTGLEDRAITIDNVDEKIKYAFDIDYDGIDARIQSLQNRAIKYLKESLEINGQDM